MTTNPTQASEDAKAAVAHVDNFFKRHRLATAFDCYKLVGWGIAHGRASYEESLKRLDNTIIEQLQRAHKAHIDALKADLAVAVQALEFYGNTENYGSDDTSRATGNECFDIICFDMDRNLKPKKDYGGKRAREALAKLNKGTKGKG